MALFDNAPSALRHLFDDGLDEILIFVFFFVFILLTGHGEEDAAGSGWLTDLLPLLIIGAFLVIYTVWGRTEV